MEYARLEIRFAHGGWSRGTLITGLAGGRVRGVVVRPFDLVVTHTLLKGSWRRPALPTGAQEVGDAGTPVPAGSVRLVRGARVTQDGRRVGRMSALWCDRATGRIMHVLVRPTGGFLRRPAERVLSAEEISEVSDDGVVLGAGTASLKALTPYRADRQIEADLRLALAEALHSPSARRGVKLLVEAGTVHVSGLVETEAEVARARQAVAQVRGVRSLTLDLVSMETLGARVEERLAAVIDANVSHAGADQAEGAGQGAGQGAGASSPRSRPAASDLHVLAEHGIVYLEGHVASKELATTLERAALAVAGTRVVMNQLQIQMDTPPVVPRELTATDASKPEAAADAAHAAAEATQSPG